MPARRRPLVPRTVATLVLLLASIPPVDAAQLHDTGSAARAAAMAGAAAQDAATPSPSIHAEEARAHAADVLDLPAGARVTVAFTPRPDDAWAVAGRSPVPLPAGVSSGRQLRSEGSDGGDGAPALESTQADTPTMTLAAKVTPSGLRREVFGFLPYWELSDPSTTIDYRNISTIAYFGVGAAANGTLERTLPNGATTPGWRGWTSARLTAVINAAHRAHTRVVLTIQSFAWGTAGASKQRALLGSPTARATLARQIAAAVRRRGADGVNLDFEPLVTGYESEFTALVRRVRRELDAVHRGYQLTFDTTGRIGNYPIEAATATGGADAIFIMGYDYRTADSNPVGSIAPTGGARYDIAETIRSYTARVAPSKLILGVPYYGRAWSTDSDALNAANISSLKTGASTAVLYSVGIGVVKDHGRRWDAREAVAWTAYRRENCTPAHGCITVWRQLYLDDASAIRAKYDLVNGYKLRGAGIWALGYDGRRPELWSAIRAKFITDTTPPRSWITRLAAGQTSPAFAVRWGGDDDSAIASYDVQVSIDGGAWRTWLTRTKAIAAVYPGADGSRYSFRVRARDIKRNVGRWTAVQRAFPGTALRVGGFGSVRLGGVALRSRPDTSAERLGALSRGSLVAITGGPVRADGYTWYRVRGALRSWPAPGTTHTDEWVAASSSTRTFVRPAAGPHQTRVVGRITGLTFGNRGSASIGPSAAARKHRSFSPNRDGRYDALKIRWTNGVDLGALELRVYRADGSPLAAVPMSPRRAGERVWGWDGRVGGKRVPNGTYYVTLVGRVGGVTHAAPSAGFGGRVLLARYGVRVASVLTPFTDVRRFVPAVEWLYMEDISAGCSATRFCPHERVTRAQMARYLARALGLRRATRDYFDDDDGQPAERSINALAAAGLARGCAPRRFCPARRITRAQTAMLLSRALDLPKATTDYFDDDDGQPGEAEINALARAGLAGGCAPRRFCPRAVVTREQMAVLLYRSLGH